MSVRSDDAGKHAVQPRSGSLAEEKGSDQNRESDQVPPKTCKDPECDHSRNGQVDRKKPAPGKSARTGTPVPERYVKEKDQ